MSPSPETDQGEQPQPRYVLTREDRLKGRKAAAEKRRQRAEGAVGLSPSDLTVTVPAHLEAVLVGLRNAAKKGSAPAAREYRALLAAFPTSKDVEALTVKQPDDMTPEEREELRAWLLREYASESKPLTEAIEV